jgi:hypothetical protein
VVCMLVVVIHVMILHILYISHIVVRLDELGKKIQIHNF